MAAPEPSAPSAHPQQRPRRVVMIEALAPAYPGAGAACNGCGLCCLYGPCPVGLLVTRKRTGPCQALVWVEAERTYRCGLLSHPRRFVRWLPARWVRRLASRWIAAGAGCDAHLERLPGGN